MKLQTKLASFGTGIAVLAVVLVGFISSFSNRVTVAKLLADDEFDRARVTMRTVNQWRVANGSWRNSDRVFATTAGPNRQEILLLDAKDRCINSFPADLCPRLGTVGPGSKLSIRIDDRTGQHLNELIGVPQMVVPGDETDSPPWKLMVMPSATALRGATARLTASMTRSLWIGGAIAAFIALLSSSLIARTFLRPVHELQTVVNRLQQGDFSQRTTFRRRDEIGSLGAAFDSMATELGRHKRLRDDLFHDVAHELRSPLTNIRCQLESFQDGLASPGPETIASLYEETMLLNRLIDDLRDIALAEAGQLHLEIKDFDVSTELRRVFQAAEPIASMRSVELQLDASPAVWVRADPGRLGQILNNLISNAIHHTGSGSVVKIRSQSQLSVALIEVEDNGPGIPPEHLPFIFDRFYRADPVRSRKSGGAGLGLAIVEQLANLQGGSITVKSAPGRGCCFSLTLPLI